MADELNEGIPLLPIMDAEGPGTAKNYGHLSDYYSAMRKPKITHQSQLKFGDIVTFQYHAKYKPEEGTRLRWAFVLHPNWQGKMHALELTAIAPKDAIQVWIPKMKESTDPYNFYHTTEGVKQLVKQEGVYRTYLVKNMSAVLRYQ